MKRLVWCVCVLSLGCQSEPVGPSEQEIATLLEEAPQILDAAAGRLEGLDGLYLGQSKEEAFAVMSGMCKRLIELDGGRFRGGTYFRGCHTPEHPFVYSFRVGFNPRLSDRVFTLEVKRKGLDQPMTRARAWSELTGIHTELWRRGIIRLEAQQHNLLVNWDDGVEGPTHIIFGYSEAEMQRLEP